MIYLVSIPLGIRKAVYNGSRFDIWSSTFIIIGYAIPAFLFAVLLIVFFLQAAVISTSSRCAGWSPRISARCRGIRKSPITSWHITLPVLATVIGGFAAPYYADQKRLSDEIRKQYVVTARAKGVGEKRIMWKRVS
ncbi:ABC transporter permease subunit [Enterobacter hormaechei]